MSINNFISIASLNKTGRYNRELPITVLNKNIVLNNAQAISSNNFFMVYDNQVNNLLLRYISLDPCPDEYWHRANIGEFLTNSSENFKSRVEELIKNKQTFFQVGMCTQWRTRYFPIPLEDVKENEWRNINLQSIFIPSNDFINDFDNSEAMFQQLKDHLCCYSDFLNDEIYVISIDSYDLSTPTDLVFPNECDAYGTIIGYERALQELRNYS